MPLIDMAHFLSRNKRKKMPRGSGHYHNGKFRFQTEWAVYLVNGQYYISTWHDLPFSHCGEIEKFYASDSRDALVKGFSIAEKHAEDNARLPKDQQILTVVKQYSEDPRSWGG